MLKPELLEQREISRAAFSERPFVTDADFLKRSRVRNELLDKFLRRSCGERPIEMKHEKMRYAEIADERDLVLRRCDQMRRIAGPQHLRGMRIERDDDRRPAASFACLAEVEITA